MHKNALWLIVLLSYFLSGIAATAQQVSSPQTRAKGVEAFPDCKSEALPSKVRIRLEEEYSSWKIQGVSDLTSHARIKWESRKPLTCPGVAVGRFDGRAQSYAILLVPVDQPNSGYRFLLFSRGTGEQNFDIKILEKSDKQGAGNFFIRKIQMSAFFSVFFDEQSRKKIRVGAKEGILRVGAGEEYYGADVFFWANSRYQHEPVDY